MKNDEKLQKFDVNDTELVAKNVEIAKDFVQNLLKTLKIDGEIKVQEKQNAVIIQIESEQSKFLIGPHGENMHAIQTLLNSLMAKGSKLSKKVLIDFAGYRENQEQKLKEKTKQAIEKCVQTAKPVSLDFMNAYERHVVHEIVLEDGRVVSESFGNEPRRFVKIFIK